MTNNLNVNSCRIINLAEPTASTDATTKWYTDSTFVKKDGTTAMTGTLNMNSSRIINLTEPTQNTDSTKWYTNTTFIKKDGTVAMTEH